MSEIMSAENAKPDSVWTILLNLIDKPQKAFAGVVAYPRLKWVLPLILAIVVSIINIAITTPYSITLQEKAGRQQMADMGMSPEEVEKAMESSATFRSPAVVIGLGSVSGIVVTVLVWAAAAAVIYFLSLVTGAEELKFGSVFTVYSWSTLPTSLQALVMAIMVAVSGRFPAYTSLAVLQATGDIMKDSQNLVHSLLTFVDPFWFWHIFLLVVGVAVVTKFSRTKSALITLVYFLLSIGLTVGLAALGGMMS